MKKNIDYDRMRWNGVKNLLFLPHFRIIKYKRECEYWKNKNIIIFFMFRFLYQKIQIKYGIEIPASTKIGRGIRLEHLNGIVINANSIIGDNCTILNGVLIGEEPRGKRKGCPNIGNTVWIGTNSIIVGNISIGNNVLIAPGSFINFDVPDNSVVLGNPGKIVKKNNTMDGYVRNSIL